MRWRDKKKNNGAKRYLNQQLKMLAMIDEFIFIMFYHGLSSFIMVLCVRIALVCILINNFKRQMEKGCHVALWEKEEKVWKRANQ